ncbi:rCG62891 [Rattus norvegicus]|uniref:RCG62891 n=1 Tax=Rattus norvegicus TaxID=10116 RepID=A6JVV8_RAT|nr:rCG62891 [Rattus norvegicus]
MEGLTVKRHMGIFFVLIVAVVTTVYSWQTSKLSC